MISMAAGWNRLANCQNFFCHFASGGRNSLVLNRGRSNMRSGSNTGPGQASDGIGIVRSSGTSSEFRCLLHAPSVCVARRAQMECRSFTPEPRSAYLLRGPSRTDWEHSIPPLEELLLSLTLRTLSESP